MANTRVEQLDLFCPPKDILYEKIKSMCYDSIKDRHGFSDKEINHIVYDVMRTKFVINSATDILKGEHDPFFDRIVSDMCLFRDLAIRRQLKDFLKNLK